MKKAKVAKRSGKKVFKNSGGGDVGKRKVLFRELSPSESHFVENKEFRGFLPQRSKQEISDFEATVVRDGLIKDAFVVFKGQLIDGYQRLSIARKHKLPYRIVELLVETKEEALIWLGETHLTRRSFTEFQTIEICLKLKRFYAKLAKKNQGRRGSGFEPIDTLKQIAEQAGCGRTLVHMVETVCKSKDKDLIGVCRAGAKTIKQGYYAAINNTPKPPILPPSNFTSPKKDQWINQIIFGDVVKKMREINAVLGACITLILTSIPFNSGLEYGNGFNDSRDYKKEYLPWLAECMQELVKSLKPGGRLIVECDAIRDKACDDENCFRRNIYADLSKIIEEVAPELNWLGDIVWYKFNPKHFTSAGTRNSCRSPRLARNHSYLLVWSKGNDHTLEHMDVSTSDIQDKEWEKMVNTVYSDIPPEKDCMKKYGHPAVWPIKLCDRLIRLFSYPDPKNIILDPFGGVGSTALAAYLCGRSYISIEQNRAHCGMAQKRLAEGKAELETVHSPKTDKGKYTTIK